MEQNIARTTPDTSEYLCFDIFIEKEGSDATLEGDI